jgi:hypothetical protein
MDTMTTIRNAPRQPKQQLAATSKTSVNPPHRRSPYRAKTVVVRIPEQLLPHVRKLLADARQDVADSAWLDKA